MVVGYHFDKSDTILSNSIISQQYCRKRWWWHYSTAHSNVIFKNCLISETKAKDTGGVVGRGGIRIPGFGKSTYH
ncbi:hypothetical protein BGS_1332 [Beggiatoa sp. SS]|nr:hypothetical protein BGS_1332 [Beggiatoa sp. SS]